MLSDTDPRAEQVQIELAQQILRPGPLGNVQQQHPAGIAHIGGEFTREPPPDFIFGQ